MAVFNPQVQPTQDPNYLNYAKVTEAPSADTSTGLALKTAGEGLEGAATIADTFLKSKIQDKVYKDVDKERDAQTAALEAIRYPAAVVPPPVQSPEGAKTSGVMGFAPEEPDVPQGVQNGIDRFKTLTEAQAQNGGGGNKVNDTYYTANLNSISKMLRAEYPGYREYIDSEISKVSGINPANAYMTNLLQDINNGLTNSKQQTTHILTELSKMAISGNEQAANVYSAVSADPSKATAALGWMARVNKNKWSAAEDQTTFTNDQNNRTKTVQDAESAFTKRAGNEVDEAFHAAQVASGISSPQKIAEYVNFEQNNPSLDGTQSQLQAQALQAHRDKAQARLIAFGNAPIQVKQADGSIKTESYFAMIGAKKANEIISEQLKPYDMVIDAITNAKTGTATYAATVGKQFEDSVRAGIQSNPKTQQLAKLSVMSSMFGNNFSNVVTTEVLKNDAASEVKYLLGAKTMDGFTQPDLRSKGLPSTFLQAIGEGKKNSINPDTKYYDNLVGNINYLNRTDVPDSAKENLVYHFFHPKNIGVLNEFKPAYYDTATGEKIEGREAVFKTLTTPAVTKSIANLARSNPELGNNYKNWAEVEFGQNIFSKNIQDINKVVEEGNYELHWDSERNRWMDIPYPKKEPSKYPAGTYDESPTRFAYEKTQRNKIDRVNDSLHEINSGLENMTSIAKSFGNTNVSAYLLETLSHSGFDSTRWANAIANSYGVQTDFNQRFKPVK